jgi:hypothetical protein
MANRSSASITIGGSLSRTLLSAFLEAVACDQLCVDYGDRIIEEGDIVSGTPFYGAAASVRGGVFDATEAFCRAHDLRYIRRSDACIGGWDPSVEIYSGAGDASAFNTTSSGAAVITLDDFRRLGRLAAIEAHFAAADFEPGPLVIVEPDGALAADA